MKRRILLAVSMLLIFGLAIVAFAYQGTTLVADRAACACCKDGSCPMKKDGKAGEAKECCDMDCCKNGDSCPVMKHGDHSAVNHEATAVDAKQCDCACCAAHHKDKKDA